jgi:hypothetical protein
VRIDGIKHEVMGEVHSVVTKTAWAMFIGLAGLMLAMVAAIARLG